MPRKCECESCIKQSGGALANREWTAVKDCVRNAEFNFTCKSIARKIRYNHGQKSWDKFALLVLLRTPQTGIQLHLPNLAPHPTYNELEREAEI